MGEPPDPPSPKWNHGYQRNLLEKVPIVQDGTAPCKDPEPTEVPSTPACPAKYLLCVSGLGEGGVADERRAALGTAQLCRPTVAWLFLGVINGHTALAFDSHRRDAGLAPTGTGHQHDRS